MHNLRVKDMTLTALMAAAICLLAPWTVPVGPIPVTLATFAIYTVSPMLSWKHGSAAVFVYLMLGLVGLPVFSGFAGGLHRLVGPTGGYLAAYLPMAMVIGLLTDLAPRRKWLYPLAMVAGTALLYTLGTAWYVLSTGTPLVPALLACVVPFLPGDGLKIVLASLIAYPMRQRLTKAKSQA